MSRFTILVCCIQFSIEILEHFSFSFNFDFFLNFFLFFSKEKSNFFTFFKYLPFLVNNQKPTLIPGSQNLLHRNNSLSPFLQRKYSLQAHQQRLNDQNVSRWRTPQYGRSISATASPNLDAHRRYQTAIPVLDTDKPPMARLTGNTSPIGKKIVQHFYRYRI